MPEECRQLGGCATGQAKITGGHQLPAYHVAHTVGPAWQGGSIAFPAISTGVYGYPAEPAAAIAAATVQIYCAKNDGLDEIIFCCYSSAALNLHERLLHAT